MRKEASAHNSAATNSGSEYAETAHESSVMKLTQTERWGGLFIGVLWIFATAFLLALPVP